MRKILFIAIIIMAMVGTFSFTAAASSLIWTPIFPSFGGASYNSTWLMAQAEAQGPKAKVVNWWEKDALTTFEDQLQSQILSRLTQKIVLNAFGEEAMKPGHYEVGNYVIDITTDAAGIHVIIVDPTTGNSTTVVIPYY